jgi:WhiB family redox-sensing transcriptional regulator
VTAPALAEDARWWHRAACKGADTEIFFARPEASPLAVAEAKAFCARCPVVAQCLAAAIGSGDMHSVRGGMTPPERRELAPVRRAWCGAGRHPRTPASVTGSGQCRECKRENHLKNHPPTGRGRGNSAVPRERDANGWFVAAADRDRNGLAA